jgi:hypothetical protein
MGEQVWVTESKPDEAIDFIHVPQPSGLIGKARSVIVVGGADPLKAFLPPRAAITSPKPPTLTPAERRQGRRVTVGEGREGGARRASGEQSRVRRQPSSTRVAGWEGVPRQRS